MRGKEGCGEGGGGIVSHDAAADPLCIRSSLSAEGIEDEWRRRAREWEGGERGINERTEASWWDGG